jgi:hypothetical protein
MLDATMLGASSGVAWLGHWPQSSEAPRAIEQREIKMVVAKWKRGSPIYRLA